MSKKERLARLLYATRTHHLFRFARTLLLSDLKILAYHRICNIDDFNDPELVSATPSDFEWQVAHVRQHYKPMTFASVVEHLSSNTVLPRNAVVITFDDGFADNYFNAYDILNRYKVPATFFIATSYIGSNRTFWFNQLSRTVMLTRATNLKLGAESFVIGESREDRLIVLDRLLQLCKLVPDVKRHEYLETISGQLGDPGECDPLSRPMTWDEVIEMSRNGMEFGSHSVTHPVLSRLDPQALEKEINESKKTIEKKLGEPLLTLSYPDGGEDAVSPRVLKEVRQAGYRLGVSYISGSNLQVNDGDMMLKRMHVERYTSRPMFAAMLALPELLA